MHYEVESCDEWGMPESRRRKKAIKKDSKGNPVSPSNWIVGGIYWACANLGLFGVSKMELMKDVPGFVFVGVAVLISVGVLAWEKWDATTLSMHGVSKQILPAAFIGAAATIVVLYAFLPQPENTNPDDPNGGFNIAGVAFIHETVAKPVKVRMIVYFRNPKARSIKYEFESASVTLDGAPVPMLNYLRNEILAPSSRGTWIPAEFLVDSKVDEKLVQVAVQYSVKYGFDGEKMVYRQRLQQICPTRFSSVGKAYFNQCTRTEMINERISD